MFLAIAGIAKGPSFPSLIKKRIHGTGVRAGGSVRQLEHEKGGLAETRAVEIDYVSGGATNHWREFAEGL